MEKLVFCTKSDDADRVQGFASRQSGRLVTRVI
jgi:hypothetical protein